MLVHAVCILFVYHTPSPDILLNLTLHQLHFLSSEYFQVSAPHRSVLLTGLPQHQNGMYGLQHSVHHFQSFYNVKSLPVILRNNGVYTGIIGKYHVAPRSVYDFDYFKTGPIQQVGRNITYMRQLVRTFLQNAKEKDTPFFLYIAFFDTHRGSWNPEDQRKNGPFLNLWGDGGQGHGRIPDWEPHVYDPDKVLVPYFLPDTRAAREDIAAMYTSFNRMDQGIGLFMEELKASGHLDDTLVMFTADNGIPFPNAKTNLYEPGQGEPMMISSPLHTESWGKVGVSRAGKEGVCKSDRFGSTMDFTPTILDWFGVKYPSYNLNGVEARLTGKSLLPLLDNPSDPRFDHVFSSHDFHEVTMAYPMRVMRDDRYRLIHNLNYRAAYPLATDLYGCPTFQDILHRTTTGQPTHWFKTLDQYYYRDEWELYDLQADPEELHNLAYNPDYHHVFAKMNKTLFSWQEETNDHWRCMPHSILLGGQCHDMHNHEKTYSSDDDQGMVVV
ncbi:N-sulphoglucosamine sulphohydrolase [Plakobranchus ocellatus]|uniref:N-sulphoglucosamine sulphohydrolase n=1 Tax=Plakobranchus ocellatus TaxID=259542 RepID=A0AAV4AMZ0_9GAST|nr:N-sulphoglucosamine sulphohydrolase [Plakobranchus ocellatus]